MSRRLAREAAMCLLFEREIRGGIPDEKTLDVMRDVLQTDKIIEKHGDYLWDVQTMYTAHSAELDEIISAHCKDDWRLERLARVDICILRLALIELLYIDNIPPRVSINEAVELAKKYSQDKSPSFINGVLASVIKEMGIDKPGVEAAPEDED